MAKKAFSFTPGKSVVPEDYGVGPVSLPEDTPCLNCKDDYSERDLIDGTCFPCRYGGELKSWR